MQIRATRIFAVGNAKAASMVTAFSPLSLFAAGEQGFWYDPSDFSTMYQDSAGTTPVTAVGQPVGRILDKSGRGNHATQSTATSRAILQLDVDRYYLDFDGVDDGYATSAFAPGSDKAQIFVGLRKAGDAATGTVFEMSTDVNENAGSLHLLAPSPAYGPGAYSTGSRGTATNAYALNAALAQAAPDKAVLTAIHDIAGDLTTLSRNNGPAAAGTGDKGAGNFLTYPAYIGRRGGTSRPFGGRIYSMIMRFGPNLTTEQIAESKAWVNTKTGAY